MKIILSWFLLAFLSIQLHIFIFEIGIIFYISIGILMLSGILISFINKAKKIGVISISKEFIQINNERQISFSEIEDFKFSMNGFDGRRGLDNFRSLFPDNGTNNFIKFKHGNSNYQYRIYISANSYKKLTELLDYLHEKQIINLGSHRRQAEK